MQEANGRAEMIWSDTSSYFSLSVALEVAFASFPSLRMRVEKKLLIIVREEQLLVEELQRFENIEFSRNNETAKEVSSSDLSGLLHRRSSFKMDVRTASENAIQHNEISRSEISLISKRVDRVERLVAPLFIACAAFGFACLLLGTFCATASVSPWVMVILVLITILPVGASLSVGTYFLLFTAAKRKAIGQRMECLYEDVKGRRLHAINHPFSH